MLTLIKSTKLLIVMVHIYFFHKTYLNLKVFYKFYNSTVLSEQNFAYDKVLLPHTKCVSRNEFGE